ncbi:hypothetical protein BH09BAC5_BH09BAC5_23450 [soil metagenome]
MKTFLTLCIFAMVSAGIYGFVDMANDVKKGTMIQYDRGENDDVAAVKLEKPSTKMPLQQIASSVTTIAVKEDVKSTEKKPAEKKSKKSVSSKSKTVELIVAKTDETTKVEPKTDVKVDSVPKEVVKEDKIDYRDFSRGAPRKHKEKKK